MSRRFKLRRRGVITVKVALLLVPIMAFLALSLDCGYLLKIRTELQSAADAAALAAARELIPDAIGDQDSAQVRTTAREYAQSNMGGSTSFVVNDADIQVGRYDPSSIYTQVSLLNNGTMDAVRVTVRRDQTTNSPVRLYFARVIGIADCEVTATATAVLPRADAFRVGDGVLPFGISAQVWDNTDLGDQFKTYGDKVMDAYGQTIPGNRGTLDIGDTNNSTSELSEQILNGLRQSDLNALYNDGRISTNQYIDTTQPITMQADTGLSSGLKNAVQAIHGETRYVPIFDSIGGENGNNAEYEVVKWGMVKVVTSNWNGSNNTYITFEKTSGYDGNLAPVTDLSDTSNAIDGVFAHPTLVE